MGNALPKFLCGGIGAGEWPVIDGKKYAKALFESRCNNMVLEVVAPAYANDGKNDFNNKTSEQILAELIKFIKPALALDLWVTLHLTNGNDQAIKHFGADAWCRLVDGLIAKVGTKHIIICPIAEPENEPNQDKLVQHCLNVWKGMGGLLMYNGGCRPKSRPAGYDLLDYHTQNAADVGPGSSPTLVDTDNGPIINWTKYGAPAGKYWGPERVRELAIRCKASGSSLNLYAYQYSGTDKDSLKIMGDVFGVCKQPSWFDKLVMQFKLATAK